jgi:hypothetical protein
MGIRCQLIISVRMDANTSEVANITKNLDTGFIRKKNHRFRIFVFFIGCYI